MEQTGKYVFCAGAAITLVGGVLWLVGRFFPAVRLGRLPGDIVVEKPGFSFFFPVTTMILASLLLTLIAWIIGAVRK